MFSIGSACPAFHRKDEIFTPRNLFFRSPPTELTVCLQSALPYLPPTFVPKRATHRGFSTQAGVKSLVTAQALSRSS